MLSDYPLWLTPHAGGGARLDGLWTDSGVPGGWAVGVGASMGGRQRLGLDVNYGLLDGESVKIAGIVAGTRGAYGLSIEGTFEFVSNPGVFFRTQIGVGLRLVPQSQVRERARVSFGAAVGYGFF